MSDAEPTTLPAERQVVEPSEPEDRDRGSLLPSPTALLTEAGAMAAMALEALREVPRVRRWAPEFVRQCAFLVSVTWLPALLISIPLGATISLLVGDLSRQLGAQSMTGAIIVYNVVREVAPVAAALLISGAGGSAMSADMGSRRIRDELAAMEVMGADPIRRLVTPRLVAASVVSVLLVSLVVAAGVAGGYVFNVLVQGVSAGAYLTNATVLLDLEDLLQSLFKAAVFGVIAGVVACSKGMRCERGPVGVGRAVNRGVVTTFVLVFVVNYMITASLTLVVG